MNKSIEKWMKNTQIDNGLMALSDIKAIIDDFYERGNRNILEWEISSLIEEIEPLCNYKRNEFLKKIKKLIKRCYEEIGRNEEGLCEKPSKKDLINEIRKITLSAKIPSNYEVISRLRKSERERD